MTERSLLNIHRKQLHDTLIQCGVDPAVSRWTNDSKDWTNNPIDTLEFGLCFFVFCPDTGGRFSIYFRPGPDGGAPVGLVGIEWGKVLEFFRLWATKVKEELEQDDPWQQYSSYLPPERLHGSTDNSPFTHNEAEHVVNSMNLFYQHVQLNLPGFNNVQRQFEPQFERLKKQAKSGAGRIDWSNQFVGMLISLCLALSLAPDQASSLWQSWIHFIDGLLLP